MARKPGDKNRDFEQKRSAILDALEERLLQPDGVLVTLNEMASVADVSLSTLRHHIGGRTEVWSAMLSRYGAKGGPYLQIVSAPSDLPVEESLRWTLTMILAGLQRGLLPVLAAGLVVGLNDPIVGPAYLDTMLEPILAALETRLDHHQSRGELVECDLRVAALFLASPLLLAAFHQQGLGGCRVRPLSMEDMVEELLRRFLAAYAAPRGGSTGAG